MLRIVPTFAARLSLISLAIAFAFSLPCLVNAQTDQGRIVGTVTDSNGGLVPGADIVVTNEKTAEARTTVTNDVGYFMVASLRPSSYSVTVNAKDLTAKATNVQLLVGQEFTLALTVQPTGIAATVDIAAGGEAAL